MRHRLGQWAAVATVSCLLGVASPARANHEGQIMATFISAGLDVAVGAGGLVTEIGSIVTLATKGSSARGWTIASYAVGGTNLVLGSVLCAFLCGEALDTNPLYPLAVVPLVIGSANVITAVVGTILLVRQSREPPKVAVTPLFGRTPDGNFFAGAGVSLLRF